MLNTEINSLLKCMHQYESRNQLYILYMDYDWGPVHTDSCIWHSLKVAPVMWQALMCCNRGNTITTSL